ncbi:MAG TPA: D-alanine--D-alanine ligase family protein [Ktedonobacterales bacterium]|jgi:D-alanine-D-alanine ligase|nr:D-alanine--D-alanine ligase family protein [Ktedonobacterales bacterium]
MSPLRVGMIFGGRSVEHEVSVLTAHQAIAALPRDKFTPIPIYISKSGQWFTGEALLDLKNFTDLEKLQTLAEPVFFSVDATQPGLLTRRAPERKGIFGGRAQAEQTVEPLDVAFPLIHGSHGEDGTLQGLLEMADMPYTGCGVQASAIGMDKLMTKVALRSAGVPTLPDYTLSRARWQREPDAVVTEIEAAFPYPVFVKPVSLGSSIGVSGAEDATALRFAIDVAAAYDSRVMIEPAQQNIMEINCSVLGADGEARASVCEHPVSAGTLSYEEKYLKGGKGDGMKGARRIIPANISNDLTQRIQRSAVEAFNAIGAAGVSRVDFLVNQDESTYYVNEINTIPGSLSFYLWEPSGVPFPELLTTMIGYAQARHREKRRSTFSFSSSLLSVNPLLGSKVGGM